MHFLRCNTIKAKLLLALLFFGLTPLILISFLSVHLVQGDMVISVPDTEAALYSRLILIFLLVIASILLTSLLLAKKFTDPLHTLMDAVEKIRGGNLNIRAEISTNDELGRLAQTLNATTAQLKKSYTFLEKAVEKKTHQLSERMLKIQQEKVKNEAIIKSIGEGVLVVDDQGKTVIVNQAAQRILGIEAKTFLGKDLSRTLILRDDSGATLPSRSHPIRLALLQMKKTEMTYYYEHKDFLFPILCIISPVVLGGAVRGAIMIFRDVTKEKETEKMKNEFVSLVSHQLRTPLSAMKWFAELLLTEDVGSLTSEQKEFIGNIGQLNERMISLVNSLLNIARIESGKIVIEPSLVDLGGLVNEVAGTLSSQLKEKGVHIGVMFDPKLRPIKIDPKLIREVYSNLIGNAIQYTPAGGRISISVKFKNRQVLSEISDTGYGIPVKEQEHVFQKFYRGSNIGVVETDGNGLGLYITKAIVESSGGTIGFRSTKKGTTFWFTLPKKSK